MKAETAKLAKRFNWWWRNCDDFTLLPNGQTRKNGTAMSHFWKGGNETAAFAYEFVRRAYRSRRLPAYPELTAEQQVALRGAAGVDQHYWIMQESTMSGRQPIGMQFRKDESISGVYGLLSKAVLR